jgi:hypothetical protein
MSGLHLEGFEDFVDKAYALWNSDNERNEKGVSAYRIFGTTINIHVSRRTGTWECTFSKTILGVKGRVRAVSSASIDEVFEELPEEAVEILVMSPFLFENRREYGR